MIPCWNFQNSKTIRLPSSTQRIIQKKFTHRQSSTQKIYISIYKKKLLLQTSSKEGFTKKILTAANTVQKYHSVSLKNVYCCISSVFPKHSLSLHITKHKISVSSITSTTKFTAWKNINGSLLLSAPLTIHIDGTADLFIFPHCCAV